MMNSTIGPTAIRSDTLPRMRRTASIDVFRGLTMTLMIFVNELTPVKGLPWWNYHAPAAMNAMTYVDVVFPAFLFVMGMTIPIALERRLERTGVWGVCQHVVFRTVALVVLGLILANAEQGDRALMGFDTNLWAVLSLVGAVLFWNVYGRPGAYQTLFRVLRFSGLALMLCMLLVFRRTTESGHSAWLNTSYPEILGLLGWTYLAVSALYLLSRRWRWAPLFWFAVLTGLCALTTAKWTSFPRTLPLYVWPFGNGALASIAMAGVVMSGIFLRGVDRPLSFRDKGVRALALAAVSFLGGWLLTPLGISKIRATPTWCLYSVGCSVLVFTLLYWVCDVKGRDRWAAFSRPAGENTLLTYLLPDFYYFIVAGAGFTYFTTHANEGLTGVVRCIVFTALVLAIAALLTRRGVRLQL